jgi:hypothetical protein
LRIKTNRSPDSEAWHLSTGRHTVDALFVDRLSKKGSDVVNAHRALSRFELFNEVGLHPGSPEERMSRRNFFVQWFVEMAELSLGQMAEFHKREWLLTPKQLLLPILSH